MGVMLWQTCHKSWLQMTMFPVLLLRCNLSVSLNRDQFVLLLGLLPHHGNNITGVPKPSKTAAYKEYNP